MLTSFNIEFCVTAGNQHPKESYSYRASVTAVSAGFGLYKVDAIRAIGGVKPLPVYKTYLLCNYPLKKTATGWIDAITMEGNDTVDAIGMAIGNFLDKTRFSMTSNES